MRSITAAELKNRLDANEDLIVINVLGPDAFADEHIPGSHNVPVNRLDLARKVEELAQRKDRPIVVYCSSAQCQASVRAGRKLEESGFTNVCHFPGGMEEWKAAGYATESGAAAPVH